MNQAIELLKQIISIQEQIDKQDNARKIAEHKSSKTLGESFILFHLKTLKELLLEEDKKLENIVVQNDHSNVEKVLGTGILTSYGDLKSETNPSKII